MFIIGSKIYRIAIHCNIPDRCEGDPGQPFVTIKIDHMETPQLAGDEEIEAEIENICAELRKAGRKAKNLLARKEKQMLDLVRKKNLDRMEHKQENE